MENLNFEDFGKREYILIGSIAILAALVLGGITQSPENTGSPTSSGDWEEVELTDINSGETYTVTELEKPVLVETFAVWCPTCTKQQREIKSLHDQSNVTSVSLNVDSNEDEQQVKRHTQENGFDWRYSISPPELTRMLVSEYGTSIANPPSAPAVLVCENGSRRLPNGVKPVSKLQEEISKGC